MAPEDRALVLDARAALRALCVHGGRLRPACDQLPADGKAQTFVFLATYRLLAATAGTSAAWQAQPSARVVRRGSGVIGLGAEEADVALGFIRLLTVSGWQRFRLETMLDWMAGCGWPS